MFELYYIFQYLYRPAIHNLEHFLKFPTVIGTVIVSDFFYFLGNNFSDADSKNISICLQRILKEVYFLSDGNLFDNIFQVANSFSKN